LSELKSHQANTALYLQTQLNLLKNGPQPAAKPAAALKPVQVPPPAVPKAVKVEQAEMKVPEVDAMFW
jgi:hypothetical protein